MANEAPSLRRTLLSRFGALAVATALLVGLVFILVGFRPMTERIAADHLAASADRVEASLSRLFEPAERLLRMHLEALSDPPPALDDPRPFNRHFAPLLRHHPSITSVVAGTSAGQGWMLLRLPDGRWRNRFTDLEHWGPRHRIFEGTPDAPGPGDWLDKDYDPRQRPWYLGAAARPDGPFWTEPYTFFTTGDPGITVSGGRTLADGRRLVLGLDIMLRDLSRTTMGATVGQAGLALVLTDDLRVLALPAPPPGVTEARWASQVLIPAGQLGLPPVDQALRAWPRPSDNTGAQYAFQVGKSHWLASMRPFPLDGHRLWVMTLAPEADFTPAWRDIVGPLFLAMALILVATLLIARRLAEALSAPLEQLLEQSERVGRLDFRAGPPITSQVAEISRLAHAQDTMATLLRGHQDTLADQARALREQVAALTRAEQRLRDSEQHFRNLANSGSTLIWTSGPDQACDYFNQPWLRFTGRTLAEELGDGWLQGIHPDDRDACQATYQAAFERRESFHIDYRLRHASGEYRWIHDEGVPRYGAGGDFLGYIGYCFDITARKQDEERIRSLANFDGLTHLPNRRLLMDRLGQAQAASARHDQHGALLILDLDNFKGLNDTQGHDAGDQLLVEVARVLLAQVRQHDTVARLGGDEYVVMLEGLGPDPTGAARQAEAVGEKLRAALNRTFFTEATPQGYHLSTSIGLTLFLGRTPAPESLLQQAEVALYTAKDAGRNLIRFFNPDMQADIDARIALQAALRRGLAEQEFRLVYQPQFDAEGRLIGAEALVRWQPPGQAPVSPDQFIPLAEETGLILPLGLWILETACAQLARWAETPRHAGLTLAVNVSPVQFRQTDFARQVARILEATRARPERLKLELTERVILGQHEAVIEQMESLRALGVGFSMDDFGTGYSSLSYLKRLPLDQLKIDRAFIAGIPDDANDAAIVRAILAMSQSLGLTVIAEGVETEAQRDFLRTHGCQGYQGFLLGRPVAIEDWPG